MKRYPKRSPHYLYSALSIIFLLTAACAMTPIQKDPENKDQPYIRLLSRTFLPKPGPADDLNDYLSKQNKKRTHVLIQFTVVPGLGDREKLKRRSVHLLDTVPEKAFFASIPSDPSSAKSLFSVRPDIRWIGPILPVDKISPELRSSGVPDHARREKGNAHLTVMFFGDVPVQTQQNILSQHAAVDVLRIEPINGWSLVLNERRIPDLSKVDEVKWIEAGPGPIEHDNDGARSAGGVNADAVHPPALFDLTGAGVTIGQWEGNNASLTHGDFAGRIVLGDPPIPPKSRSNSHDESVAANGNFDNGENIYVDMDDSGDVSVNDIRSTANAGFPAGSTVFAGNPDVGTPTILFQPLERYINSVVTDGTYSAGEPIYFDADGNPDQLRGNVSIGDTRLTAVGIYGAGSVVVAGHDDIGDNIFSIPNNPHDHATHVAGTAFGSGAQSLTEGGAANQWMGMAPGANLRSYRADTHLGGPGADYPDAIANGVTIATNSWGITFRGHFHQLIPPATGYDTWAALYDSTVSGRQSDGTPSGLAGRLAIFAASGNEGRPERYVDNSPANGLYDQGETIYIDNDDSGNVSANDTRRVGGALPNGTALVNFNLDEMHDESVNDRNGLYENPEGIYRDADGSRTVTAGDTRITAVGAFASGSVVAAPDADVGTFLRQFRMWGNIRNFNSAKNPVTVGNTRTDAPLLYRSSSRGPTLDGRLKPDVTGPGGQAGGDGAITSTFPGNIYDRMAGSSMSTPAVAGAGALTTEWFKTACNPATDPDPDLMKALLVHTSSDVTAVPNVAGVFSGPDFAYGYGRVQVDRAVGLIPHHRTGTAGALGDTDFTVTVGQMDPLRVTLVWSDPSWTVAAAPSAVTGMLQNDLDLVLIAPDGTQYTPWMVDPDNPPAPAVQNSFGAAVAIPGAARDRRNTVEQVVIPNAMGGTWTIRVTASTLNLPSQDFVLVSETFAPQDSTCAGLPAGDVFMRDNSEDHGDTPSEGRMWLSPAIWNRLADDGMTTHDNPEFGQTNYLYATIENPSDQTVRATTVEVWIAAAAVGLAWPDDFSRVGTFYVPNIPPDGVRQIGPLAWNPPEPDPSSHFCFYVRVTGPQDPIIFAEGAGISTNTRNSNNIVWRNLNIVDLLSKRTVTFQARNVNRKHAEVDLVFEIPQNFLDIGQVSLELPVYLERKWLESGEVPEGMKLEQQGGRYTSVDPSFQMKEDPQDMFEPKEPRRSSYRLTRSRVELRGIPMDGREAAPLQITFGSTQKKKASYDVHVVEKVHGEEIGGILFRVRTGMED